MAGLNLVNAMDAIRADGRPFYVYILRRPSGVPFYVGKGTGDRLTKHEWEAARPHLDGLRLRVIRAIQRDGGEISYEVTHFDDEAKAFQEERRLIALHGRMDHGTGTLVNHTDGGEGSCNPSVATIEKRAKKLRAVMKDPAKKAAAVATLRSAETVRAERAIAAMRTPEFRKFKSDQMLGKWSDQTFREKVTAASASAQDLVWKANHAQGVARVQADPDFHSRRNAGVRRPDVQARIKASLSTPAAIANKRAKAVLQRESQNQARSRVEFLSRLLCAKPPTVSYRASLSAWESAERVLLNGGAV